MRRSLAFAPALVALTACSLIENFDGYTSPDGGSESSDAALDSSPAADGGADVSGDAPNDAVVDGTSADGPTSGDAAPVDAMASDGPDSESPVAYVYVVGGVLGISEVPSSDVLSAPAYADGSLGAWKTTTSLPVTVSTQGTMTLGGSIFIAGGTHDGTNALTSVYSAQPTGGGDVGAWGAQTPMGTNRFGLGAVASNTRLYAIGGHDSGGALAGVEGAAPGAGGAVTGWSSYSVLPVARDQGAACIYNGFIYLTAGSDDGTAAGASSVVYAAPIAGDGSLGTWVSTSILMTRRWGVTCAVVGARLYVLGGQDFNGNFEGDVQWSPIASDGTLGSWTQTTGFAPSRFEHATVVIGNFLYVIGGAGGSAGLFPDVEVAQIAGDGSIAGWTATTPLPAGRALHGAVAF